MTFAKRVWGGGLRLAASGIGVAVALVACGGGGDPPPAPTLAPSFAVAKAICGSGDTPETGLQGQIPMAERVAGFKGSSCNLQKVSASVSSRGENLFEQFQLVRDRSGHLCGYAGPAFQSTSPGTTVVDLTDPSKIIETEVLTTSATKFPGEGLRVHEGRGLLVTAYYNSYSAPRPEEDASGFDVYDVGTDCRHPQLLSTSTTIKISTAGLKQNSPPTITADKTDRLLGHEGAFSPDGLTYWIGESAHSFYHAIDITDPTHPKYILSFQYPETPDTGAINCPNGPASGCTAYGSAHGLSISNDGNRAYPVTGGAVTTGMVPQTGRYDDGFMVVDTSEVQARRPNPTVHMISHVVTRENSWAQMTIPVTIAGQKYAFFLGEMGAGEGKAAGRHEACAAGVSPFALVHLYYMGDENAPKLINKIRMEANDPKNCDAIAPEIDTLPGFVYDVHMCSVDNRDNATTLACGYFSSGIRVYDIRDPRNIKEIAYFIPAALKSGASSIGWCAALPILDAKTGMVFSRCQDSGMVALKFKNGVWPFPETTTPPGKQL